jgi:hypothetical protein
MARVAEVVMWCKWRWWCSGGDGAVWCGFPLIQTHKRIDGEGKIQVLRRGVGDGWDTGISRYMLMRQSMIP